MLWLLLVTTLARAPAVPSVGIVVSRRTAVSRERASEVKELVYESLRQAGLAGVVTPEEVQRRIVDRGAADPESCDAQRTCVARIGKKLGFDVMVGIDLGTVLDELAMDVEAVNAKGTRLARRNMVVTQKASSRKLKTALRPFATALSEALAGWKPKVAAAPPVSAPHPAVSPGPRRKAPPPVVVATRPAPLAVAPVAKPEGPSRLPGYLTGAGAIVLAGAAVAFTVKGFGQKSDLSGPSVGGLTWNAANDEASGANRNVTLGLVTGCASAALTGLAIYFFTRGD